MVSTAPPATGRVGAISGRMILNWLIDNYLNVPYAWGGTSKKGVDCSGLMWLGARQFGINIPRTSNAQLAALKHIAIGQAQIGDLVFFDSDNNGQSDHVGMYAGDGRVLVADHTGTNVRIVSVSTEARITGVGRMAGVINESNWDGGLLKAGRTGGLNIGGLSLDALMPSARPTLDLFGPLGLQSPNAKALNENYGLSAAFLESDPELANLYSQAVAGTWSTDQFQAALMATNWWANNSDTARKMIALKATDPATYNQQVKEKQVELTDLASKMGVHLSVESMNTLAQLVMTTNMNNAQVDGYLSKYLQLNQQGHFLGYAGQVELGVREYARDMGVPITDDYVNSAVRGIVAGTDSLQARRAHIQTLAEDAFPQYADQIKEGVTVGEIAAPYLAAQSKLWEVDPNKLDLFDPTLRSALTKIATSSETKPGEPQMVPLYDFEKQLRSDPRWLKTNNARESMSQTAGQVLSDLGLISTTVGGAPQTTPDAVTQDSRAGFGGLSGKTDFPTLQGQNYQNPGRPPQAADLAQSNANQVI